MVPVPTKVKPQRSGKTAVGRGPPGQDQTSLKERKAGQRREKLVASLAPTPLILLFLAETRNPFPRVQESESTQPTGFRLNIKQNFLRPREQRAGSLPRPLLLGPGVRCMCL